jgi:molybdate transport system ATP-binding protein
MKFELDITKRMRSGNQEFVLQAEFSCSQRALVLFGPSGSGKTLTLQAVAGLLPPDAGRIRINGDVLYDSDAGVNLPTRKRHVGYVFQDYALFPHLTVRQNVAFGLKPLLGRMSRRQAQSVDELIELFGLSRVAGLRPSSISGGQRQRTALARALATQPRMLLLDEPFSALDQPLRLRMRKELARILERFDIPMVMVTHDPEEAECFAQAVVVYRHGTVAGVLEAGPQAESGTNLAEALRREAALAYAG